MCATTSSTPAREVIQLVCSDYVAQYNFYDIDQRM